MTSRFIDKFGRPDGSIGTNYTVACGGVLISDEAVIPINAAEVVSGVSPLFPAGVTALKTQVLYTAERWMARTTWCVARGPTTAKRPARSIQRPRRSHAILSCGKAGRRGSRSLKIDDRTAGGKASLQRSS